VRIGAISVDEADALIVPDASGRRVGEGVARLGDVDGDGLDEVLLGVPQDSTVALDAGIVALYLGPVSGSLILGDADATWLGIAAYHEAGSPVGEGGDIDGDGLGEVVTAAAADTTGGAGAGAAFVLGGGVR
jgi:hypothetical protein